MNILAIFTNRHKYMTSVEDRDELPEGMTEFQSAYNTDPRRFTVVSATCTIATYDAIKDKAGTLEAPALIADANAARVAGRVNVYVENGSLKLAV